LDFNSIKDRDTKLINNLIAEFDIEYKLDFMLEKFKSMFLSVETNRTRAIAVLEVDDKKTKRIQVVKISPKEQNAQELIYRLSVFISLFRQLKAMKEIEDIETDLKTVNQQLVYQGYKYFKELNK